MEDLKVSYLVIKSIFISPNPSEPLNPHTPEANLIEFTDFLMSSNNSLNLQGSNTSQYLPLKFLRALRQLFPSQHGQKASRKAGGTWTQENFSAPEQGGLTPKRGAGKKSWSLQMLQASLS